MTRALSYSGVSLQTETLIALRHLALAGHSDQSVTSLPGGLLTRKRGQGVEVADVREYIAGDDIRHLDRGTTARTGRLHIRQFREERDRVTLLVADFRASMFWGLKRAFLSVAAAEALVLFGWKLVEDGGRVGLLAITTGAPVVVPPRAKARGMLDVIGGLVQAHATSLEHLQEDQDQRWTLDHALARVERLAPKGAEILIASGFDQPGEGFADVLDRIDHLRKLRLVVMTENTTQDMPQGWYPMRLSDGKTKRVFLTGPRKQSAPEVETIASHPALVLSASDPVELMCRRISSALVERYAA